MGKFNLKDMVLWNGVHSGITAMSERLKEFADTILPNTQTLFRWVIVILLLDSSLHFNSSRKTYCCIRLETNWFACRCAYRSSGVFLFLFCYIFHCVFTKTSTCLLIYNSICNMLQIVLLSIVCVIESHL